MTTEQPYFSRRSTHVALLVAGAFFMENLDGTVIATALPQMAVSFHTSPPALAIGMTAYLLTLAVFIPASGWVADRYGPRRVFACAIALFTVASILCGASQNAWEFTLARVLQGCGGALMTPVGRLVVLRGTEKKDLMRAIATLTWPALTAPVLGPPVGGFITSFSSWRWIFLINVPLGLVALLLALRLITDEDGAERRPFDRAGFLLNGASLASLLYALDVFGQRGGEWRGALVVLVISMILGWLALRHAARHPHPLVSLAAFGVQSFRSSMLTGGFLTRLSISTLPFLLPLLFQVGLGMSPFMSGLLVLWYGLSNLAIKPWTSPILRRFGFRTVLAVNALINAAAIGGCALIGAGTPIWITILLLLLAGASRSMQFTATNTLAFADVPAAQTSAANTLFNMMFQLSVGMGIAFGAIALRVTGLLAGGAEHAVTLASFHVVFPVIACLALLPLFDFLGLPAGIGATVSGHKIRERTA